MDQLYVRHNTRVNHGVWYPGKHLGHLHVIKVSHQNEKNLFILIILIEFVEWILNITANTTQTFSFDFH